MKNIRSNIQIKSNIYPVNATGNRIDFDTNPKFVSRIVDRKAIRRLIDILHPGLNYDELRIKYAKTIKGLSEWQVNRIGIPDSCALAQPDEKPWGICIVNGDLQYVCKCEKRDCVKFKNECRPELTDAIKD